MMGGQKEKPLPFKTFCLSIMFCVDFTLILNGTVWGRKPEEKKLR